MDKNTRAILGVILVVVALFLSDGGIITPVKPKIEKPSDEVIALVDSLSKVDEKQDSNKLSGLFHAMSKAIPSLDYIKNRLSFQYWMADIGQNTVGSELMDNGKPKYPGFAPSAAAIITKVIGPQDKEGPLSPLDRKNLGDIFHGFAWKLYNSDFDEIYEQYKAKATKAIEDHKPKDDDPDDPDDPNMTDCDCNGTQKIRHGDGHVTNCPCVGSNLKCKSNCKSGQTTQKKKLDAIDKKFDALDAHIKNLNVKKKLPAAT